jgi:PAS domain S-box-containing protein
MGSFEMRGIVRATGGTPFITYYPAIIISTLVGGFWPGVLSQALSAVAAWYFFMPPTGNGVIYQREATSLLLFVCMSGFNVVVVALLNRAVERVMTQEENLRVLIESAPTGIIVVDEQGEIKLINASTEKLFGYNRLELLGQNVEELVPERQRGTHRSVRALFFNKPEARLMAVDRDLRGRRKDGSEFPVEIGLNPISRNGKAGIVATVIDITERKQAREGQQFVIRELQHRTQNLFGVIQALASRSLEEGKTLAEAKHVLSGRLQALARAYATLASAAWQGASLAEILGRQLAGFSERVTVSGCDIVVSPSAAQQFALIIHELATNALKYGALSMSDGRVSIEGKIERLDESGLFSFLWRETGGPPPSLPTRKGFGSVVLLDSVQHFARTVAMNFEQKGLTYELQLYLSAMEP